MSRQGARAAREARVEATEPAGSPWRAVAVFAVIAVVLGLVALVVPLTMVDTANGVGAALASELTTALALAFAGLGALTLGRGRDLEPVAVGAAQHRAHSVLGLAAGVFFLAVLWALPGTSWRGFGEVAGWPFAAWLVLELVVALLAEYGWRGALQPLLETRMPRVGAALVVGLCWWLWQVPLAMTGGEALVRLLGTLTLSVLLGFLGNGSPWQRTLPAALARWMVAIATFQLAGDDPVPSTGWWAWHLLAAVVTTGVFLAMFVVATRRRRARAAGQASARPR